MPNVYLRKHFQLWLYIHSLKYRSVRAGRIWEETSLRSPTVTKKKFVFNVSGIKGELNGAANSMQW